jgi:peptidoglycan/LPS O-acetylase OafA/YrhL
MLARQHQSWYWLHLTNFMMALGQIPGHGPYSSTLFWSLAVEEQFYLLWPAIVALCSIETLRKVCIVGALSCIALRIVGGAAGVSGLTLSVIPITRGDTLFVGGLLAIQYRSGGLRRYAETAKLSALIAAMLLVALTIGYGELDYMDRGTAMFGSIAVTAVGAWALVAGISSTERSRTGSALRSGVLRFFGRYSYALYIVHTAVLAGLNHYRPFASLPMVAGSALPAQVLWVVAYVGGSTGIAIVSWHMVEKHFLRLKKFFPYRRHPETA